MDAGLWRKHPPSLKWRGSLAHVDSYEGERRKCRGRRGSGMRSSQLERTALDAESRTSRDARPRREKRRSGPTKRATNGVCCHLLRVESPRCRILSAEMSGTTTPHLRQRTSASERARRNAEMAARKATGATWAKLAAEYGVGKSTAQKAVADHLKAGGTVARDALDVGADEAFREALATYSWALDGLRALAAAA